mgnify:CR=1 FL=1
MEEDKGGGVFGIFSLLVLLTLLAGSIYFLWLNLPSEPVELIAIEKKIKDEIPIKPEYSTSKQFYENMRFPDREISYRIEPLCGSKKASEVEEAFGILESKTIINFYPASSQNTQIRILCSEIAPEQGKEGYFVAGEGGPTEVINTTLYSVILSGKVSFFREEKCEKPNIAIHEILHVLGFNHNNNPKSILYETLACDQTIDDSIINDINSLYSVDSKPDLKIVNLKATKAGGYLNFNIEIINQGLKNVNNVKLGIYADDKFIKEFDLENIEIGTRKFLDVQNLKISRSADKITFVVNEDREIEELFVANNKLELVLAES